MSLNLPNLNPGINTNPYLYDTSYSGLVYAFVASGGFTIDQCFNTIKLYSETPLIQYDVTQAVQVRFDVRTFNQKIGLLKDDTNNYVTDSSFNSYIDRFPNDSITISADEFVAGMTASQVLSVGTYSTLYTDYIEFVNTYFGYAGGFSSLFAAASEFDINHGVFDENSFINIINPYTDVSGENVKPLTGTITISNINELLRYAVDANVFNNRTPATTDGNTVTEPGTGYASDLCGNDVSDLQQLYQSNYGVADGFIAGDLIFIPAGTTVSLHVDIDAESNNPLNNIGPANVMDLISRQDFTSKYGTSSQFLFTETSRATTTNIDRTLTAPLLIKLDNLSTTTENLYQSAFIDANGLPISHYMNEPYRHYTGINGGTTIQDYDQTPDIHS